MHSTSRSVRNPLGLLLLVIFVVVLLTPPPQGPIGEAEAAKNCSSCHSKYNALEIQVNAPPVVGLNMTDTLQVSLGVPWKHEARDVQVTISLPEGAGVELAPDETATKTIASISSGALSTLQWELEGKAIDTVAVTVSIDSTSYYNHKKAKNPDSQNEHFSGDVTVSTRVLELALSPSIFLAPSGERLETAIWLKSSLVNGNMTELELVGEGALNSHLTVINLPQQLGPGEAVLVNLTFEEVNEGILRLNYTMPDGTLRNTTMTILVEQPISISSIDSDRSGYYLNISGLYGWIGVGIVIVGMVQGFTKRWFDSRYTADFTTVRRAKEEWSRESPGERASYWWWIHTLLLFAIIVFTYIHVLGAFRSGYPVVWDLATLAGVIALGILFLTGMSGLHPPWFKQRLGTKGWKQTHAILSAIMLVLVIYHGLLLRNVI